MTVVVGTRLCSKGFQNLMAYKMEGMGIEGLRLAMALLALPFVILTALVKLLPTDRLTPEPRAPQIAGALGGSLPPRRLTPLRDR